MVNENKSLLQQQLFQKLPPDELPGIIPIGEYELSELRKQNVPEEKIFAEWKAKMLEGAEDLIDSEDMDKLWVAMGNVLPKKLTQEEVRRLSSSYRNEQYERRDNKENNVPGQNILELQNEVFSKQQSKIPNMKKVASKKSKAITFFRTMFIKTLNSLLILLTLLVTLFPPVEISSFYVSGLNPVTGMRGVSFSTIEYEFLFYSGNADFAITRMDLQYLLNAVCFGLLRVWTKNLMKQTRADTNSLSRI